MKQSVLELVLLTVASVGVALGANAMRERKRINLSKDYFAKTSQAAVIPSSTVPGSAPKEAPQEVTSAAMPLAERNGGDANPSPGDVAPKHLEHPYQTATVEEALDVFNDPQTEQGLNVFIDARDEERYAEGHIPGAIQCYPYEISRCIDRVKEAASGADKVIVYCGGGDCEDSIFMCRELIEAGISEEAIFLFEGGWKEWASRRLPAQEGAAP